MTKKKTSLPLTLHLIAGRSPLSQTWGTLRLVTAATLIVLLVALLSTTPGYSESAGTALAFDGVDDNVKIGDMGDTLGGDAWTGAKTVSVWVNPTAPAGPDTPPNNGQLIVGNDRPRSFGITRATYDGQDKLWVWNTDSNGLDVIGVDFVAGQWVQIALVHDGTTLSAYKDGTLVGSVPSGPTSLYNGNGDGSLYIGGAARTNATRIFAGEIDEVRFWTTVLDAGTLQAWTYSEVDATHPQWANLMAYYKMSDGAGTTLTDDSGHENTGTLNGGMSDANWVLSGAFGVTATPTPTYTPGPMTPTPTPTTSNTPPPPTATNTPAPPTETPTPLPAGDPGSALSFDGANDFVELDYTAGMMDAGWEGTKTVSLWVKPVASAVCINPQPAHCDVIFGDRPRWWGISIGVINGNDRIWIWNNDHNNNIDVVGIDYTLGEWTHIALVHDAGLLTAYKNGVAVGTVASGPTAQPSTGGLPVLHLGGIVINATRNYTFAGELDEVRVWNVARTPEQLAQDMFQTLTGQESGLAAYYQMSDGAGLSLTDDSGHGWTGTLNDGTQNVPPDGQPPQWVPSGAFNVPVPTPTNTPVSPTPTATNTPTPTNTPEGPTATPTNTPTATNTPTPTATSTPAPPTPTATPTNTPLPAGEAGYALTFDGIDDNVKIGDTGDTLGGDGWANAKTVSVWVNPTAASGPATTPNNGQIIVGNDRPRSFGITRAAYNGADKLWVWNTDADGLDFIGINFIPGEWIQVTLVHDGATLSVYKNGVLVDAVPSSATLILNGTGDGSLYIGGAARTDANRMFAGEIDEVRFWTVALDAATLQVWLMNEIDGSHPSWADLPAYYKMSDGAGTSLTDDSGNGNTGTLYGGMSDGNWIPSGAFSSSG